jgi:hypothetical protein
VPFWICQFQFYRKGSYQTLCWFHVDYIQNKRTKDRCIKYCISSCTRNFITSLHKIPSTICSKYQMKSFFFLAPMIFSLLRAVLLFLVQNFKLWVQYLIFFYLVSLKKSDSMSPFPFYHSTRNSDFDYWYILIT